jgi:hypothetical protein
MLLQRGAPVNVKDDAFQATPIRWALHAWANSDDSADRERACAVIALLVRAGGQLDPDSLDARLEARMKADPVLQAALQGYDGHAHE